MSHAHEHQAHSLFMNLLPSRTFSRDPGLGQTRDGAEPWRCEQMCHMALFPRRHSRDPGLGHTWDGLNPGSTLVMQAHVSHGLAFPQTSGRPTDRTDTPATLADHLPM